MAKTPKQKPFILPYGRMSKGISAEPSNDAGWLWDQLICLDCCLKLIPRPRTNATLKTQPSSNVTLLSIKRIHRYMHSKIQCFPFQLELNCVWTEGKKLQILSQSAFFERQKFHVTPRTALNHLSCLFECCSTSVTEIWQFVDSVCWTINLHINSGLWVFNAEKRMRCSDD